MSDLGFTDEQISRYSRHILLAEVGGTGQRKLMDSSALMVGAGGLGSPALLYLAAAGVGRIGICDADELEVSNLQRQIIHFTSDLGKSKVASAENKIRDLNPDCEVTTYPMRLDTKNVKEIVPQYDVVLDGTDNFPTRFLLADFCQMEEIPLVSAAAVMFHGQLMTLLPGKENPCYRCMYPEPPPPGMAPSCQEAGILGAVVGVMGSLQALEAIKVLLGVGGLLSRELLVYDALDARFTAFKRARDPDCPLCGKDPTITALEQVDISCMTQEDGHD